MRFIMSFKAAVMAVLLLSAQSALAQLMNFEDLSQTEELAGVGDTYTAFGYTLFYAPAPGEPFPVGFHSVGPRWRFNTASTALFANSVNASTTLKRNDGRPFAMIAIDLAETNGGGASPVARVQFVGTTSSGATVTHAIELDNQTGFQRFFMPTAFRDVTVVQWLQGDNENNAIHMFDNLLLLSTRP
jgi:hypothetical protein